MQKELKYSGFSAVPSDYECPDGSLAASLNLISEDGAIRPLASAVPLMSLPSPNLYVAFIHKGNNFSHYIIVHKLEKTLWWCKPGIENPVFYKDIINIHNFDSRIIKIEAVGNTLVVLTEKDIHYILWKDDTYNYLGTHIPECPLYFSLIPSLGYSEKFSFSLDGNYSETDLRKTGFSFPESLVNDFSTSVLAQVNKFIAERVTNRGLFIFPFFLRYAIRLYDGSLTMHSAPIFLCANSATAPRCNVINHDGKISKLDLRILALISYLRCYRADDMGNNVKASLEIWKDIIASVDIFISKPIYTYDQNGTVKPNFVPNYYDTDSEDMIFSIGDHKKNFLYDEYRKAQKIDSGNPYGTPELADDKYLDIAVPVPSRDPEIILNEISGNCNFFLLKSIPIDDLLENSFECTLTPPQGYLDSLTSRELLTDDYQSHDSLVPESVFAYNSRLNLANVARIPYTGFPALQNESGFDSNLMWRLSSHYSQNYKLFFTIKTPQGEIIRSVSGSTFTDAPFLWIFYPDSSATKAVIQLDDDNIFAVSLSPHPTLNGAYWFGDWKGACIPANKIDSLPSVTPYEKTLISLQNKIYTSEINNPFFFPLNNIVTVGTGKILSISTAARPLSQGQFGQFPLYAFTDEGVWALEVSNTGTYSARQPITRDVCINPDSITQIDSAVLFATDRGIMLISGSTTSCISQPINSQNPFNILSLPGMTKLHAMMGHEEDTCFPLQPFSKFLSGCGMVYDYINQHIILFNPSISYSYIYSLKSQNWGMMFSKISSAINSYPDALAMDIDGNLVSFSNNEVLDSQLLVSRPFKLDAPDTLKTIDTIIQRGYFRKGHVKSVLYGSRDLFSWHLVWSSQDHYLRGFRGTPYKYFRLALLCNLSADESIYGASVSYTPRLMNNLR